VILVCPICHGEVVGIHPIINTDNGEIFGYYGYCKSLKCRVRRITYDRNFKAISFTKWNNLSKKRKFLYETLKSKRKNGNWTYKKKTNKKWNFLKNLFKSQ